MERMTWKEGWNQLGEDFEYLIENGKIVRGFYSNNGGKTVYPYRPSQISPHTYNNVSRVYNANKRNFEKLVWR